MELRNQINSAWFGLQRIWIVSADYSALEAHILAALSGDPLLAEWLKTDQLHENTAKVIFKRLMEKQNRTTITKEERQISKTARYACHYGSSIKTATKKAKETFPALTEEDMRRFFSLFKELHPKIIQTQQLWYEQACKDGYIEAPLSHRRHEFYGDPEPTKCNNLPIQDSGSHLLKLKIIAVTKRLDRYGLKECLFGQVHDSLFGQTIDYLHLARIFKEEMTRPIEMPDGSKYSFPVEVKYGPNFGEMEKLKI